MIRLRPGTGDMSSHIAPTIELTTRRRYTREEKAAIVAESLRENSVSAVARRHRVAPAQLFRWKKEFAPPPISAAEPRARKKPASGIADQFVPVIVPTIVPTGAPSRGKPPGEIEIAFPDGCVLRVSGDVDEEGLSRVIRALRA